MTHLYFCDVLRQKFIENILPKTELLKTKDYQIIMLVSEQTYSVVIIVATMYKAPNNFCVN
jgi:hypothetical protein